MKKPNFFHKLFPASSVCTPFKLRLEDDLEKCYSIQDWLLLREVLRFHIATTFQMTEFVDFLLRLNGRLELLQYIECNLTANHYAIGEIVMKLRSANTIGIYAIKLFMEKYHGNYSKNQYGIFANEFLKRKAELEGNVSHHYE